MFLVFLSKITRNITTNEVYIEQLDKTHVTYTNGEKLIDKKLLNHGDRIIFGLGGSHYFRFNNPSTKQTKTANSKNEFKDYQFAKNELEDKQSETLKEIYELELNKCKQDGDLKLKKMCDAYEENLEKIVT
jgi:kinesin family protein 14